MGRRETVLDWQILEKNADWPPPVVLASDRMTKARRPPRRWLWRVLGIVLALALPALIAGYREVRRAEQAMDRVENEVRAAVAAEAWNEQHAPQVSDTVIAPLTGLARQQAIRARIRSKPNPGQAQTQALGLEAREVEVRGNYAMVEVWATVSALNWLPAPYRQTRFYQETAQGWLQVAAPDVFYQPLVTLQVGRFTFVYGPRDAAAVQVASAQIERVDVEIRTELGLPATNEALTIKIITDTLSWSDPVELARMYAGAELIAPSPALLPLPAHISEADALLQLAAGLLIQRGLDEALARSSDECTWRPLVEGVRRWLLYEHSELPSGSRYQDDSLLRTRITLGSLPRLTWLGPGPAACPPNRNARGQAGGHIDVGTATSLVAYAVRTYGRDRLPALIDGIKRYDAWETLLPAVYGVSAAEFEAGWWEYLRDDKRD